MSWQVVMLVFSLATPVPQPMALPERAEAQPGHSLQASRANSLAHQPENTQVVERLLDRASARPASPQAAGPVRGIGIAGPAPHGILLSGGEGSQRMHAGLIRVHLGRAPPFFL